MLKEIITSNQRTSYNNLMYHFKTKHNPISFGNFSRQLGLKRRITAGSIITEKVRKNKK